MFAGQCVSCNAPCSIPPSNPPASRLARPYDHTAKGERGLWRWPLVRFGRPVFQGADTIPKRNRAARCGEEKESAIAANSNRAPPLAIKPKSKSVSPARPVHSQTLSLRRWRHCRSSRGRRPESPRPRLVSGRRPCGAVCSVVPASMDRVPRRLPVPRRSNEGQTAEMPLYHLPDIPGRELPSPLLERDRGLPMPIKKVYTRARTGGYRKRSSLAPCHPDRPGARSRRWPSPGRAQAHPTARPLEGARKRERRKPGVEPGWRKHGNGFAARKGLNRPGWVGGFESWTRRRIR